MGRAEHRDGRDWLTADHLLEILAIIIEEHANRDVDTVSADERVTTKGVRITVNCFRQGNAGCAHLITLAAARSLRVVLEDIAVLVRGVLEVDATLVPERAHVTMLFTLDDVAEDAFRNQIRRYASPQGLSLAVDALLFA